MPSQSSDIPLASAITALRHELESALSAQEGEIRFETAEISLKLQTTVTSETSGEVGIKWWLLNAGAEMASGNQRLQEVNLTLRPLLLTSEGTDRLLIDDES